MKSVVESRPFIVGTLYISDDETYTTELFPRFVYYGDTNSPVRILRNKPIHLKAFTLGSCTLYELPDALLEIDCLNEEKPCRQVTESAFLKLVKR